PKWLAQPCVFLRSCYDHEQEEFAPRGRRRRGWHSCTREAESEASQDGGRAACRGTSSRTGSPLSGKWPSVRGATAVIEVRLSLADVILVGDVGGTHARFALVDPSEGYRVHHRQDLTGNFPTFTDALRGYLEGLGLNARPRGAAIAVAGPVT